MKAKTEKKAKVTLKNRQPWGRLDEKIKEKIVEELQTGLLTQSGASKKYGIPKSTIGLWRVKHNLVTLFDRQGPNRLLAMNESQESKLLLKKIEELTKALAEAQLKNVALETMIEVAESELHIKIRKKRGTKQS
jgi:hypothetical protein